MNIFVGKTESLRAVKWNPLVYQYDHEAFFLRLKMAGLSVESCPQYYIKHAQHRSSEYNFYKQRRNLTIKSVQAFCREFEPGTATIRAPYWLMTCMSKSIAVIEWETACEYPDGWHWFRACQPARCVHVYKHGFCKPVFKPVAPEQQHQFSQGYAPRVRDFKVNARSCWGAGWLQFAFWQQNSGCTNSEVYVK